MYVAMEKFGDFERYCEVFRSEQEAQDYLKFELKSPVVVVRQRNGVDLGDGRFVFIDPKHPFPHEISTYTPPDREVLRRQALGKLTWEEREALGVQP